jgi:hypothetical protein
MSMRWVRHTSTGEYWARDNYDAPKRVYRITRTPYGKTGWTFEAFYRPFGGDSDWTRIPLTLSFRLNDSKQYAERHLAENPPQ